jgi:hypothetical protein
MNEHHRRAAIARSTNPFLTTKQAAYHLGLSPRTLSAMRLDDRGPLCRRHGRQWFYHITDIEDWTQRQVRGGRR